MKQLTQIVQFQLSPFNPSSYPLNQAKIWLCFETAEGLWSREQAEQEYWDKSEKDGRTTQWVVAQPAGEKKETERVEARACPTHALKLVVWRVSHIHSGHTAIHPADPSKAIALSRQGCSQTPESGTCNANSWLVDWEKGIYASQTCAASALCVVCRCLETGSDFNQRQPETVKTLSQTMQRNRHTQTFTCSNR